MNSSVGDFDDFAAEYETLLRRAVGKFAGQTDYYSSRKAELLKKQNLDQTPMRILDFGCGTGHLGSYLYEQGIEVNLCSLDQVEKFGKLFPGTISDYTHYNI